LTGEPGTGREAFARYIHALSSRAAYPFVAVSAAILTEDAAIPFLHGRQAVDGHEPGQYEQADQGTLFIGGLEDLPPATQRLLLRDLRSGQYVASDDAYIRSLDFRIVSSAQPGFATAGSEHSFDHDLLSHLSAVILRIPPLREYSEDVPDLLSHYVDRLTDKFGLPYRRFSVAAQNRLRNYEWPGNLHELQSFVRKLLILGDREEIGLEEVERELSGLDPIETPNLKTDLLTLPLREAREEFERAYVRQQLLICNAQVDEFAKRVGMETTRAYSKLRSLGLAMPLREARQQFERAYLRRQLMNCNGKVEQLAKRAGMERTHVYRKLHSLGVDFQNEDRAPHSGLMGRKTSDNDRV
jgi:two-component system, NtrC family, nitrogen regulation response regulator NtrX